MLCCCNEEIYEKPCTLTTLTHAHLTRESHTGTGGVVQFMEQRAHEVRALKTEIEKLKRRELSWSVELQDAASVTSQLTERMELLEAALYHKEESLQATQVLPPRAQCNAATAFLWRPCRCVVAVWLFSGSGNAWC